MLVAVLHADGTSASAWTLTGPGYDATYDLAALPEGGFTMVGSHEAGIGSATGAIPGNPTDTVGAPMAGAWAGFAAGYTADGSLLRFDATFPSEAPPTEGFGTSFTAVGVRPDGVRFLGWSGSRHGVPEDATINFGLAGCAIARVGVSEAPEAIFPVAYGFVDIAAIVVRSDGDLVIAGSRWGPATYAPGAVGSVAKLDASTTMFVARLTPDGDLVALFEPSATGGADARGLALRPDGDVFVVGTVSGLTTFAPGVAIDATGHESFGFLARLDGNLVPVWAHPWTAEGMGDADAYASAACVAVAALPDGGCVVGAESRFRMTFDGVNVGTWTGEQRDGLITRHDGNGDLFFAVELTGPSNQRIEDVAIDPSGAVLVVGSTYETMFVADLFGESLVRTPNLLDGSAGFVLRIDADGRLR